MSPSTVCATFIIRKLYVSHDAIQCEHWTCVICSCTMVERFPNEYCCSHFFSFFCAFGWAFVQNEWHAFCAAIVFHKYYRWKVLQCSRCMAFHIQTHNRQQSWWILHLCSQPFFKYFLCVQMDTIFSLFMDGDCLVGVRYTQLWLFRGAKLNRRTAQWPWPTVGLFTYRCIVRRSYLCLTAGVQKK